MRKELLPVFVAMAVAMAGCAAAPEQKAATDAAVSAAPAAQPAPVATAAAEEDGMVCRTEAPIGTRFMKKSCKSRAEIAGETQAARETMKTIDRKGSNTRDPGMPSGGG